HGRRPRRAAARCTRPSRRDPAGRPGAHRRARDDRRLSACARRVGEGRMSWRRLRTLLLREVRATLRDWFTLSVLVFVPLGSLLAFGFVLATDVKHLALGVLDASASPASRRLVADLAASGTFDVHPVRTREDIGRE